MISAKTSNHAKAPICAAFVSAMREAFGEIEVVCVREGDVRLGKPTEVRDLVLVSWPRFATEIVKGVRVTKQLPPLQYMAGRLQEA